MLITRIICTLSKCVTGFAGRILHTWQSCHVVTVNYARGVHLIVALGFCKAHYKTYPYSIHFNRLVCSPLTEIQFQVLGIQALNADK